MASVDIPPVQNLGGVYLIDTQHIGHRGTVGAYLLPSDNGEFALVESGPASTLDMLEAGIRMIGLNPDNLRAVLVTHIHLDHAGAAGTLARRYGADVYVHEVGARHLLDPTKLLVSAERIYGEHMERLWGETEAVPEDKLHTVADGDTVTVVGHSLDVLYTPGHASHHVSYRLGDGSLFAGDAAGIRFDGSAVVRPALPPPDIDLDTWDDTLDKIRRAEPSRLLLTHFGAVTDVEAHLAEVSRQNEIWANAVLEGMREGDDDDALAARVRRISEAELERDGAPTDVQVRHQVTSNDAMTVMGLKRYWNKHHPERLEPL
ncbi:MAG: MBL fold metallo-hydrolase [Trueperaceae bacterium]|nr:MBL fold metallo-hydrolase [Trueperaceae bacterium]